MKWNEEKEILVPSKILGQFIVLSWHNEHQNVKNLRVDADLRSILALASELESSPGHRSTCIESVLKYLDTDTLLFWDQPNTELGKWQLNILGDCLKLVSSTFKIPAFRHNYGFDSLKQDGIIIQRLQEYLESLNSFKLAAFFEICNHSKSAIVAWALSNRILSTKQSVELSLVEQSFQASKWGRRREYHEMKEAELLKKLSCAALFFVN